MMELANTRGLRKMTIAVCGVAFTVLLSACTASTTERGGGIRKERVRKSSTPKATQAAAIMSLPAPEIIKTATRQTKDIDSLSYRLLSDRDGDSTDFSLSLDSKDNCVGSMTTSDGNIQILKNGTRLFMKFDKKFWTSQGDSDGKAANLVGDRWIETGPTDSEYQSISSACNLDKILTPLTDKSLETAKGDPATVGGVPSIAVTEKRDDEVTTVHVATDGNPRILKIVTVGGDEPSTITFTNFNKPVNAVIPSHGESVPLDEISGGHKSE